MRSSSQLDKRSKTCFFTFLNMYVSRIERDKILSHDSFTAKIQVFCRPEWTNEGSHGNEFWQYSNTKMNITKS